METQNTQSTPNPTPPPQMPPQAPPPSGSNNNSLMAVLAYLGILVLIPLLTEAKNDSFVKFHIQQGLVMLIAWVLGSFLFWVPFVGWILWLGIVVLTIIGIMNAVNGHMKELPVIGHFGSKFRI